MKKCLSDESLVIMWDELRIDDKLHFVEEPVEIIDCEIKQLKRSCIPIIKCNPFSSGISFHQQGELSSLAVGTSSGSGNLSLAVGIP
nr:putative reverse transcriptase domain-containing protein [Tanacetum cinerariifolium]